MQKMEFQNRDLKSIIKYKMTDSLNNTLKNLQNKVTQISTEPNVSTTSKSQGLISIVKIDVFIHYNSYIMYFGSTQYGLKTSLLL